MSSDAAELAGEVDALPDGWQLRRLGDVARLGGGTTPARGEAGYWDHATIPWATPSDITSLSSGQSTISSTENMVTKKALVECSLPLNDPGTVLMTSRASIGFAAINTVPMTTNQGFITFNVGPDLDPEFLLHWLIAQRPNIVAAAGGSTFKEISRGTAKLLPIHLPPLDEQQRIAEVVRSVDDAIAAAHHVVAQASSNLEAAISMLVGSDHLSSDWRRGRCDTFFLLQRGFDITESQAVPGPYQVISSSGPTYSHSKSAVAGPVVVTGRKGRLGTVFYSEAPCWPHDTTLWVKDFKGNHPRFVYWKLRQMNLSAYDAATSVPTLNRNNVHALQIAFPPLGEQIDIAKTLDMMLSAIVEEEKQLLALHGIKSSISGDLFSGRVRVPAKNVRTTQAVPSAFKRAVFAAEIVHQLHKDSRFGSVKHEKIVHLCELHLGLQDDLDRHAYKEAAGPYDPKARRSVERIFRQQKWFDATKPDGNRVVYVQLSKAGGHAEYFDRYFGDQKPAIQSIIDLLRPLNTEQCEIVATLYAVWNDFLIEGKHPTEEEIVASVLQWHPEKQQIAEDRWLAALPWMHQKGLIPKGMGEKTRVAQT